MGRQEFSVYLASQAAIPASAKEISNKANKRALSTKELPLVAAAF